METKTLSTPNITCGPMGGMIMETKTLSMPNITCGHCVMIILRGLSSAAD